MNNKANGKGGGVLQLDLLSEKPIFQQIAGQIEDAVFTGGLAEGSRAPSTNELAALLGINPHTVLKGMNLLVEEGILEKKRGMGMYVAQGAVEAIRRKRQAQFYRQYVRPLLEEAAKLNMSRADVAALLEKGEEHGSD